MIKRNDFLTDNGKSQRQLRVGELLRRSISEILLRGNIHDPDLANISVTVGEVRITPDLRTAIIYVLPLGGENAETVIDALNRNKGEIRHALNKKVSLKYSPNISFILDKTFEQLDETRRLLNQKTVKRDISSK